MPNVNLDLGIQAKKIHGNFGTIDHLIINGNLDHDILNINNLTFDYKEGKIKSNLTIQLSQQNGPKIKAGKIDAQFKVLNIDEIQKTLKQRTDSSKVTNLPQNIDLEFNLSVKNGILLCR